MSAKGFSLRYLRSRSAWTARTFLRVAGEMVASEPFHRDDFAGGEELRRFADAWLVSAHDFVAGLEVVAGAAGRARDGLRMKAAIPRIVILLRAEFVERPAAHRGVLPVVGQPQSDACSAGRSSCS